MTTPQAIPPWGIALHGWETAGRQAHDYHQPEGPLPPKPRRRVRWFRSAYALTDAWFAPKPWHGSEGYVRRWRRFEDVCFYDSDLIARKLPESRTVLLAVQHYIGGTWDGRRYSGWSYGCAWSRQRYCASIVHSRATMYGWTVLEVPRVDDHAYCVRAWLSEVTMWLTRAQRARQYGADYRKSAIAAWTRLQQYCERFGVAVPVPEAWMKAQLVTARMLQG